MKLVKFIDDNGRKAWVNPTHVVKVTLVWSKRDLKEVTEIWCINGRQITLAPKDDQNIDDVANKLNSQMTSILS